MIKLYAIMEQQNVVELLVTDATEQTKMESLLEMNLPKIRGAASKLVKHITVNHFRLYFFGQNEFKFIMITDGSDQIPRMQKYLCVVADIFYENEDQDNFPFILRKIINEINRIEFNLKGSMIPEDEQDMLMGSFKQKKMMISQVLAEGQPSKTPYVAIAVLTLLILILIVILIEKKSTGAE